MINLPVLTGVFERPRLVFTLANVAGVTTNPKSVEVVTTLQSKELNGVDWECRAFTSPEEIARFFRESGIAPSSAVVIVDRDLGSRKRFHPTGRNRRGTVDPPAWACGAQWMVEVGVRCDPPGCARQVRADFGINFGRNLDEKMFPWGPGKRGEQPPVPVEIPETINTLVANLNSGPDLAAAIADTAFAAELPLDSRISWFRIPPEPLYPDVDQFTAILQALRSFEVASGGLIRNDEAVQELVLAGVDLPPSSPLSRAYLFPHVSHFSVGRPDLHYTGRAWPFASEIDEMPGGMPELVHLDVVYNINQDRWTKAFDWLCQDGLLVFLVSDNWSKCYIPETEWLVGHLKQKGYPVELLTTNRLDEVEFRNNGLFLHGARIATMWRQFPIFETKGLVADVVMAAYEGNVRLVPEFAPYGNKTLFSAFRSHEPFYRGSMAPEEFQVLDQVLPHSYIVGGSQQSPYPFTLNGYQINNLNDLQRAPKEFRDRAVLKVCGANNLAARSYGVLMGNGIDADDWKQWIDSRHTAGQPFIVQHRLEQGVARIPVMNTKTKYPELFSCRILTRPWSINDQLVSIHGCAVPSYLYKVHGMVDMAIVPFSLPAIGS